MLMALILVLAAPDSRLGIVGDSCEVAAECEAGLTCRHQTCTARSCERTPDCPGQTHCVQKKCVATAQAGTPPVGESPPPQPSSVSPGYPQQQQPYQPNQQPRQYQPYGANTPAYGEPDEHESRLTGLWVAGLVIDLGVWAIRAIITAGFCSGNSCQANIIFGAFVPVIGAWIEIPSTQGDAYIAAQVASGIVETAGFIMFVTGLAIHRHVQDDRLGVAPLVLPHASGVSVFGKF